MAVLALVTEAPMHAYRMQQLIKERHKDDVINVAQRNSIYQTIDRLNRDGLIAVRETSREENRPERTVYEITETGRAALREWMHTMLSTPAREFPEFPAALAFLPIIPVAEALEALRSREETLAGRVATAREEMEEASKFLDRLFLVEAEHQVAVTAAELEFVRSLVDDLAKGRLTWDLQART
jgi:DNA-binding PadR family transcriptional regulator